MDPGKKRTYGYLQPEKHPHPPTPLPRPDYQEKSSYTDPRTKPKRGALRQVLLFSPRLFYLLGKKLWDWWKQRKRVPKRIKHHMWKKLWKICLILGIFGTISIIILVAWASKDLGDIEGLSNRQIHQSTKIYDRTGEHLLYEIYGEEKRTLVKLSDIPTPLVQGVIATEDRLFYEHHGVRPLSIAKAFLQGVFTGERIRGASTLTQQLVKNAILTNERSITRKIKEAILSIRIEQKYTKDEILEIYFNQIPYGSTNYGVQAAAQAYFGKNVQELNLQESATLAGLPQSPTSFLKNQEALKQRRNVVLRRMYEEGYISEEEKNKAQAEPITLDQRLLSHIEAPHFVTEVKAQLAEQFSERQVDTGGLNVITTLDWNLQQLAQKAVDETGKTQLEKAGANNLAMVATDPKTGEVLALVGSADFFDKDIDGQFNVVVDGRRQPGSSFKPIVYAAAFEKGYTPDTVLFDVSTNFSSSGKPYQPQNYDQKERGPITMRYALQGSLNIPAVKTLYLVGEKKAIDFAERLGYTTLSQGDFGLSLVLGGGEVSMLEHVSAYATFANEGVRHNPSFILKVEDAEKHTLFEKKPDKGEQTISKELSATISNILSDDAARAYIFGAGSQLTLPGRPVAVKTGTTNNYVDAWTVGYTPSLAVAVWAGNTNNAPMNQNFGGSVVATPVWNRFMKEALKDKPVEAFPKPPENTATKPALRGGQGGSIALQVNKVTGKIATSSTPAQFIVDRSFSQPHDILHYVQKDDPRGDAPQDPNSDPQYAIWEAAITQWIERKKTTDPNWDLSFEDPPTEYDDEYSLEMIPTLTINSPLPSSTLFTRDITTDISVSAPRGVTKVSYKIDDQYVGSVYSHPFNLFYSAKDLADGPHILTVIVEDDIGNKLDQIVPFVLQAGAIPPRADWQAEDKTISSSAFPQVFLYTPIHTEAIAEVQIFASHNNNTPQLIKTDKDFSNLFQGQKTFTWSNPGSSGTWVLSTNLILKTGEQIPGDSLTITVE